MGEDNSSALQGSPGEALSLPLSLGMGKTRGVQLGPKPAGGSCAEDAKNKPTGSRLELCVTRELRKPLSYPGFPLNPQFSVCPAPADLI